MAKLLLYQNKIIEKEKSMSNQELFDEVLSQAGGDDWEGCFTPKGFWEFEYLENKLRERLVNWFAVEHRVHTDAVDSAVSTSSLQASADTTSQTVTQPTQRG